MLACPRVMACWLPAGKLSATAANLLGGDVVAAAQGDVEIRKDDLARRAGVAAEAGDREGRGRDHFAIAARCRWSEDG